MVGFVGSGVTTLRRSSFVPARCATAPTVRTTGRLVIRMLSTGDTIPGDLTLMTTGMESKTVKELFGGKTVAVCAVPGALTPTCTEQHVPGFLNNADKLKAQGVDDVFILSVNDPFVMKVFEKELGGAGKATFLADGDASFAKAIGLTKDTGGFGGIRSARYSMVAKDGIIAAVNVDPGAFEKSSAEVLLSQFEDDKDPLAVYCAESPDADECRTYDN